METNILKFYKCCAVPMCKNTTISTPEKLFIHIPKNKRIREKWLKLCGRDETSLTTTSTSYFCEDHFDLEKDMANYCKYKMGFSQKILMVDGAVPSKFDCQDDRAKNILNVRNDLNIDSKKKFVPKSWEHLHHYQEVEGIEALEMIPETANDAWIGGHPYDEYKREQEKKALQTSKSDAMETIQFSYSSSTDSAQSEADVYGVRKRKLKSHKSIHEPSTSKIFAPIQYNDLDTVKAQDLDEELESVISNLEQQRGIKKPLKENTEIPPGIRRQEEMIEQHKCDAIIANVYNFLKQEYEMLKRLMKIKYDVGGLSNILQRTAAATNVSKRTVINALQAHNINMAISFDHIYERENSSLNSILRKAMMATNARHLGRKGRKNKRLLNKQTDDESDGVEPPKRRLTGSSVGSTSSDEKQLQLNAVYSYDTRRTINISQANNNNGTNNNNNGANNNNNGANNNNNGANNNYGINNNEEYDGIDGEWLTPPKEMKTKSIFRKTASDDQQVPFPSPIQFRLPEVRALECKSELADEYPLMLEVEPLETESSSIALEEPSYPPDAAQFQVKFKPANGETSTALEVLSDPPVGAQVEVKLEPGDDDSDICTDYSVCDPTPLDIKPEPPSE